MKFTSIVRCLGLVAVLASLSSCFFTTNQVDANSVTIHVSGADVPDFVGSRLIVYYSRSIGGETSDPYGYSAGQVLLAGDNVLVWSMAGPYDSGSDAGTITFYVRTDYAGMDNSADEAEVVVSLPDEPNVYNQHASLTRTLTLGSFSFPVTIDVDYSFGAYY